MITKYEAPPILPKGCFGCLRQKMNVIAYHESLGFKVEQLELSSELLSRLLPNLANSRKPLFAEDGLFRRIGCAMRSAPAAPPARSRAADLMTRETRVPLGSNSAA